MYDHHAETAPALASVWRHLAQRVMELNRVEPRLLQRLTCAPTQAFHAYCASIATTLTQPAEACARALYATPPKALLQRALVLAEAGPTWRLLKHLDARALDLFVYQRLAAVAEGSVAALLRAQPISLDTLDAADLLEAAARDCEFLRAAAPAIRPLTTRNVEHVVAVIAYLRVTGGAGCDRLLPSLKRARTINALRGALTDAFRWCSLPSLGLAVNLGRRFKRIATVEGLRQAGKTYDNCLRALPYNQIEDFLRGRAVILEYRGDAGDRALVKLEIFSCMSDPLLASVGSIFGPKNRRVAFEQDVRAALAEIPGIKLVPELDTALGWMDRSNDVMAWHERMLARADAENDEVRDLGEADEEEFAPL